MKCCTLRWVTYYWLEKIIYSEGDYRPISLLNAAWKYYTKIIANMMNDMVEKVLCTQVSQITFLLFRTRSNEEAKVTIF